MDNVTKRSQTFFLVEDKETLALYSLDSHLTSIYIYVSVYYKSW